MRTHAFFFVPHRRAVDHYVDSLGIDRTRALPFHDRHGVADWPRPLIFDVRNHPEPIPPDLRMALEARGCVWLVIDDTPARQKAAIEQQRGVAT
jgi:hypothetical protein